MFPTPPRATSKDSDKACTKAPGNAALPGRSLPRPLQGLNLFYPRLMVILQPDAVLFRHRYHAVDLLVKVRLGAR